MLKTIKTTPLTEDHKRRGAKMMPFASYDMPVQYQGVIAEHHAVRTQAGIFDVSHMGHCRTTDRSLSRLLSRPLEKIAIGRSCYMLIMNDAGGIIDDCITYRLTEDSWHIVLNASRKEIDVEILQGQEAGSRGRDPGGGTQGAGPGGRDLPASRFPLPASRVEPMMDTAMIALQGPESIAMVGELCLRRCFAENAVVLGMTVPLTARTGYTGEDGYEFMLPAQDALGLWTRLIDAGAIPCGLSARDVLRIEAALPLYGMDISETIDPFEAGLAFAVDFEREDNGAGHSGFVAHEALMSRRDSKTARRRVGLKLPKGAIPRHDYPVQDAAGRTIGIVTSGTFSPMLDCGIALALVEKDVAPCAVQIRGVDCKAEEVELPFYKASRRKI